MWPRAAKPGSSAGGARPKTNRGFPTNGSALFSPVPWRSLVAPSKASPLPIPGAQGPTYLGRWAIHTQCRCQLPYPGMPAMPCHGNKNNSRANRPFSPLDPILSSGCCHCHCRCRLCFLPLHPAALADIPSEASCVVNRFRPPVSLSLIPYHTIPASHSLSPSLSLPPSLSVYENRLSFAASPRSFSARFEPPVFFFATLSTAPVHSVVFLALSCIVTLSFVIGTNEPVRV